MERVVLQIDFFFFSSRRIKRTKETRHRRCHVCNCYSGRGVCARKPAALVTKRVEPWRKHAAIDQRVPFGWPEKVFLRDG